METEFTDDIRGNCDICLTSDCGPSGVRVTGTPVAVGLRCVQRLAAALPRPDEVATKPKPKRKQPAAA